MPRLIPWDYAVRNAGRAPWRFALTVFGTYLVVLLVVAAAAFVHGMRVSLGARAVGTNVVLLGAGSEESLERSEISSAAPGIASASIPGIRERFGVRYVSPEIVFASEAHLQGKEPRKVFATFRGVREAAYLVHPEFRLVDGRTPGPDEIVAGRLASARLGVADEDLRPGAVIRLDDRDFTVVGTFEAPGTVMEAELWVGLEDLRVTTKRDHLSCVVLTMDTADGFDDADLFTKQRLDLELVAVREQEYYDDLFAFYAPVRWMVWVTALLVAAGALLGGLNTLYAAFSARIRELATLQAVGYSRLAIVVSLVQESVLGSVIGALLATLTGFALLDGLAVKISMGAFGLSIDGGVVLTGLAAGVLVGVFGALPPALRCLSVPVAQALRSG